jgi:hypothetical protein
MAEKRMFSKKVTETDDFLAMALSTQALYFHLSLNADDDGFVDSPQRVMRITGASKNELDLLIAKQYIIPFKNGVCVIRDWRINNYLRNDRYQETIYKEQKAQLSVGKDSRYTIGIPVVSIDKNRLDKSSIEENAVNGVPSSIQKIFDYWQTHGSIPEQYLSPQVYSLIETAIEKHGEDKVAWVIKHYCDMLADPNWKIGRAKYKLWKLLTQKFDYFTDTGEAWINYKENVYGGKND